VSAAGGHAAESAAAGAEQAAANAAALPREHGPDGFAAAQEQSAAQEQQAEAGPGRADQIRLLFASFLMLFIELALIRWVTANNVYVTKATNFMLLASFLGIGIGFLNARAQRDYLRWTPVALLVLVAFVLTNPVILESLNSAHPFKGLYGIPALPQPLSLALVFLLTVSVMVGIGQGVARIFIRFRPLAAYRLDILGSIAGIAVFSGLAFLDLPPAAWGVIGGCGLAYFLAPRVRWWQLAAIGGVVVLLVLESVLPHQRWSPYNKLSTLHHGGHAPALYVSANNIPYQAARSLAVMREQKQFYFYPYRHVTQADLGNVLIIGAGTGNDSAVALSEGARHVDAVEIDPLLLRIGRSHPNHPFQNPRLTTHVADGRAYLQNTNKRYNLILFALPDSLTALAGQSAIRLESYLLTAQSLQAAQAHLAPGGTFAMYNYYAPFLLSRYATTIEDVFHRTPCAEVGPPLGGRRLAVLTVHPGGPVPNCASYWHGGRVAPATDDHPFPYLRGSTIPAPYLLMLGAILLGSLLLIRVGGGSFGRMRGYADLAFMGAAFLLLETKNVVQFALLFGTTWFVNSLVFGGVLIAVYLAVETASHVRLPRPQVLYAALIAALALAWVVPQASLLSLPMAARFLAASALAFAPVFLANLVFAQRFSGVETASTAFAVNLLGAMVGGTLEYVALITGYHFLLIVIGVLYGLAFVTGLWGKVKPQLT
jgi:multisubunit Na+/H+ antiporter MnhG subunit